METVFLHFIYFLYNHSLFDNHLVIKSVKIKIKIPNLETIYSFDKKYRPLSQTLKVNT